MTTRSEWIKCSERMPPFDVFVLGYYCGGNWEHSKDDPNRIVVMRSRHGADEVNNLGADHQWETFGAWRGWAHDISHWMPLPAPPERKP